MRQSINMYMIKNIPLSGPMICQRAEEILTTIFHVKLSRIEYAVSKQKHCVLVDLQFLENVDLEWSANLHLKVLCLVRGIKDFKTRVNRKTEGEQRNGSGGETTKTELDWRISFNSETNLGFILSKENNISLVTGKFYNSVAKQCLEHCAVPKAFPRVNY